MTDPRESPEEFQKRLEDNKAEMYRLLREQWAKGFARAAGPTPDTSPGDKINADKIEEQANTVVQESDIERESARLHEQHYLGALDDALDRRDFDAARQASKELTAYREALKMLNKPKDHFARVEFERRQTDAAMKDRGPSR